MNTDKYKVLLFYNYKKINNVDKFKSEHLFFCKNKDLKGRIIISEEGINGTLSGPELDCTDYINFIGEYNFLKATEFKINDCEYHLFPKMSIKIRKNLININRDDLDPTINTGKHISSEEFMSAMQEDDSIVVDMRSNYEHNIGKFKNAVTFDIKHFLTLEESIRDSDFNNDDNRSKKILTYCTGGIRCEKASSLLLKLGYKNVYQLDGGIIKYANEVGGKNFDGKCYVFDDRIAIDVNKVNPKKISRCYICDCIEDIMVNCMNTRCNRHTTICKKCYFKLNGCCSYNCKFSKHKRPIQQDYYK